MKDLFANLFEFGGSFASIAADDLYDFGYAQLGLILFLVTLLIVIGYYKVFDRPRFHRWWHWLTVLGCSSALMFFTAWLYIAGAFAKQGLFYPVFDYIEFLMAVALYTAVLFFLLSLFVKYFSTNRRRTPF